MMFTSLDRNQVGYADFSHGIGKTCYQRLGSTQRELIVLVSGATLPMEVWRPLITPLVERGFQVLCYDLPGRGRTQLNGLGADFQAHLDQLEQLLDGLHIKSPARMVGLASGALIVAELAAQNPTKVSQVILVAPDGAATHFTLAEKLLSAAFVGPLLFRFIGKRALSARVPRYSARADVQEFVQRLLKLTLRSRGFYSAVTATMRTFPLRHGAKVYERLAATGLPACVVWGKADLITPPDDVDFFKRIFGSEQVHILENIGHLPFVEDPDYVARLIADSMKS